MYDLYDISSPYNPTRPPVDSVISVSGLDYPRYKVIAVYGDRMWIKDTLSGHDGIINVHAYTRIIQ